MNSRTINDLQIGDYSSFERTITEEDIVRFAELSGDYNPVHLDEEYAKETMFKKRIAHGLFISSLFSTILGTELPGKGSIYLNQELKFKKPVYINDTLCIRATVMELNYEKNRVMIETTATNQDGLVVVTGSAILMPPVAL